MVAIAFALFWVQLLGHEVAHTLGRLLSAGAADLTVHWPRRVQLSYFAAGPVFTLAAMAVAAGFVMRSRNERRRLVASVLGCSAASRVALILPGTWLGQASDERAIGRLLGVPLPSLGMAELLVATAAMAIIVRSVPSHARRRTFGWIAIGVALGLLSAVTLGNAAGLPVGGPLDP